MQSNHNLELSHIVQNKIQCCHAWYWNLQANQSHSAHHGLLCNMEDHQWVREEQARPLNCSPHHSSGKPCKSGNCCRLHNRQQLCIAHNLLKYPSFQRMQSNHNLELSHIVQNKIQCCHAWYWNLQANQSHSAHHGLPCNMEECKPNAGNIGMSHHQQYQEILLQ